MKKLILKLFAVLTFFMSVTCLNAYAVDTLQGTWANSGETVIYVFDGNGSGYMEHATHNHKITYTINGNKLKITFPDNDGHGLSDSFTFEVEGSLLNLTIEGKTAAQKYEKKTDNYTRPNKNNSIQSGVNDPHDHDHDENGNIILWLLIGGAGGVLLTAVIAIIIAKKRINRLKKQNQYSKQRTAIKQPGNFNNYDE